MNAAPDADDSTRMQCVDIYHWLPGDILCKAEQMSMAHGLTLRAPLVDTEVFDVAARLPSTLRVSRKNTKAAFRMAASKYLPDEMSQRKKLGFPVPIRLWLREEAYYQTVKDAFTRASARLFFNTEAIVALLDAHRANVKTDHSRKIWALYAFIIWYEENFAL
jgi:asparagine synthase (glutamine-hydrolysing)